ncbi:MAG: TlpA family protein disulfide reductase [Chitinophagaceae bacterium]|nr:MAG: TlpA family protein disulfide reductase [Chitinophagaceae bacterium]
MKTCCLITFICLMGIRSFAQENASSPSLNRPPLQSDKIQPIKIGQKVPETFLRGILNYKDSTAQLSDFYKGKLLIIDFWATWCSPCITSLPILDSIHKVMSNKVNIIAVTYQTKDEVKAFFKKHKNMENSTLPFVVGDEILSRFFPYKYVPQEIWIDSNGYLRGITTNDNVTVRNIDSLLNNNKLNFLTKKDSLTYDSRKYSNFQDKDILFRSVLAKTPLGIGGGWVDFKYVQNYSKYYKRIFLTHRTPLQLFYTAYTHGEGYVNYKRIFFDLTDSTKYIFPTHGEFNANDSLRNLYTNYDQWLNDWEKANDYCYELIMPHYVKDTIFYKYMLQDLNRCFDIQANIEKRLLPCIVIKLSDPGNTTKLRTTGLPPQTYWNPNHDTLKRIQNEPLSVLVSTLNSFKKNDPVIDLTHYTKPVDMNFNNMGNFFQREKYDVDELRKDLAKYGLEVIREKRLFEVLIIKQR